MQTFADLMTSRIQDRPAEQPRPPPMMMMMDSSHELDNWLPILAARCLPF